LSKIRCLLKLEKTARHLQNVTTLQDANNEWNVGYHVGYFKREHKTFQMKDSNMSQIKDLIHPQKSKHSDKE